MTVPETAMRKIAKFVEDLSQWVHLQSAYKILS